MIHSALRGLVSALGLLLLVLPALAEPLVIAHRGASGYLPEHTLAAYALAFGMGADFIEPDLVMTGDGALIARHDLELEKTTDVAQVFPDRRRQDGHFYAADFSLAEVRRLQARAPRTGRFAASAPSYAVPTFGEVLDLVAELNRLTGRNVGVYPEIKHPRYHRGRGLDPSVAVLAELAARGLGGAGDPVVVQCFDAAELRRLREELGSELRLVQLVADHEAYAAMLTAAGLAELADYAHGIGPDKILLRKDPELVARAHAAGLRVHPYTFRADDLAPDESFDAELRYFFAELRVDGVFTDHPDRAAALRDALAGAATPAADHSM